jgi:hypothetical protein
MNEAQSINRAEESKTSRAKTLKPRRFQDPLLDTPVKLTATVIFV